MKKASFVLFFCLFNYFASCQLEFQNSNVGRMGSFTDFNGQSLLKKYDPEITGTPFLADWKMATLTFFKGKKTLRIPIRFNLEGNEVYYRDSLGKEMVVSDGILEKIEFSDSITKDSKRYVLKTGYPAVPGQQNSTFFYQVLSEGKIDLLVKNFKYISEIKDEYTKVTTKEFVSGKPVYYISKNNTIQELYLNKNSLLSFLTDKIQLVDQFIKGNKLNLKKLADVVKVVDYYNTLL